MLTYLPDEHGGTIRSRAVFIPTPVRVPADGLPPPVTLEAAMRKHRKKRRPLGLPTEPDAAGHQDQMRTVGLAKMFTHRLVSQAAHKPARPAAKGVEVYASYQAVEKNEYALSVLRRGGRDVVHLCARVPCLARAVIDGEHLSRWRLLPRFAWQLVPWFGKDEKVGSSRGQRGSITKGHTHAELGRIPESTGLRAATPTRGFGSSPARSRSPPHARLWSPDPRSPGSERSRRVRREALEAVPFTGRPSIEEDDFCVEVGVVSGALTAEGQGKADARHPLYWRLERMQRLFDSKRVEFRDFARELNAAPRDAPSRSVSPAFSEPDFFERIGS